MGTPGRAPGPGEEPCDGDDELVTSGRHDLANRLWAGSHLAVSQDRAVLVQEADRQGAGRQVEATVRLVRLGGAAPEVSSS